MAATREPVIGIKRKAGDPVDGKPADKRVHRDVADAKGRIERKDGKGRDAARPGNEEKQKKGRRENGGKTERGAETGTEKAPPSKEGEREKVGLEKLGAKLGSMIGRKRKMRQGK